MGLGEAKTRVATFRADIEYIKYMRGELGIEEVSKLLHSRGINTDIIKSGDPSAWVPVRIKREFLYAVRDALGWNEKRIYLMGRRAAKESIIVRFHLKSKITMDEVLKIAANMWKEHNRGGILRAIKVGPTHAKIVLENFDIDPLYCKYLEGYILGIAESTRSKNITVKETKCTFKGEKYHEYTVTWNV